jgi:hypothetical protein
MVKYMASNPLTSIPVHSDVVRRLRSLKTADQTWDEFLLEMAEDHVPAGWYAEVERRRTEGANIAGPVVLHRSRANARKGI